MGACFDQDFVKDPEFKLSKTELDKEANALYEQAAYNYGHAGYTGTLAEHTGQGVVVRSEEFDDANTAWDWIQENHDDKWDTPWAVKVKGQGWAIGCWCSS